MGGRIIRTAIYIDGFNFYYWLKPTPYRWLDLRQLILSAIQKPGVDNEIVLTKYFTARVSDSPSDPRKALRQQVYIDALKAHCPGFSVYFGEFKRRVRNYPLALKGGGVGRMTAVWYTEEKGSDVNIAVHAINDAWNNSYDCAVIVTNDSDQECTLQVLKRRGKRVGIVTPGDVTTINLRKNSNFQVSLTPAMLPGAQMPDEIPGTKLHIPDEWKKLLGR